MSRRAMVWRGAACHVTSVVSSHVRHGVSCCGAYTTSIKCRGPKSPPPRPRRPLAPRTPRRSEAPRHLPPPAPPRLCHDLSCRGVAWRVMSLSHGVSCCGGEGGTGHPWEARPPLPPLRRGVSCHVAAWPSPLTRRWRQTRANSAGSPPSEFAWSINHAKSVSTPPSDIARSNTEYSFPQEHG